MVAMTINYLYMAPLQPRLDRLDVCNVEEADLVTMVTTPAWWSLVCRYMWYIIESKYN